MLVKRRRRHLYYQTKDVVHLVVLHKTCTVVFTSNVDFLELKLKWFCSLCFVASKRKLNMSPIASSMNGVCL